MNIINRLEYEQKLWDEGFTHVMGLDEAGRGCLAGPVVAAGVIFEPGTFIPEIKDSKQLPENERDELALLIKSKAAFWTVQECNLEEIDRLNILWASIAAMLKCVDAATPPPGYLLVDGNRFTSSLIPHTCIVKGDDLSMSIAAASILAKVHRDAYMRDLNHIYPEYGWESNVGYPTTAHRKALKELGYTEFHRKSFNLGTTHKYVKHHKSA